MNPLPTFPNGAHFAVSLTYDDGIPSHIEDVAPTLEVCGLRGTFNTPIARASVMERAGDWRDLAARGHELGNHSLFHPCRSTPEDPKPFVGPYNLVDYDERRLREELEVANFALHMIDGQTQRTYANTCWHRTYGSGAEERPMEPILAEYFLAARGVLNQGAVDLAHVGLDEPGVGVGRPPHLLGTARRGRGPAACRRLDHLHLPRRRPGHPQPYYRPRRTPPVRRLARPKPIPHLHRPDD